MGISASVCFIDVHCESEFDPNSVQSYCSGSAHMVLGKKGFLKNIKSIQKITYK